MTLTPSTSIKVRKIVPVEERMRALMEAVKNRETKMLFMLLGAHLRRYPNEAMQIRYEMTDDRKFRVYLEPATEPLTPELASGNQLLLADENSASNDLLLYQKEQVVAHANAFQRQSPISDPRRVAIEVINWNEVCSINYVPHSPNVQANRRKIEGTQAQSLPPV